jgi:hypothetical protein
MCEGLPVPGQPGIVSAGPPVRMSAPDKRPRRRSVKHKSGIVFREADLSKARPFRWAWEQRILIGYINLLVGVEGVGKGNLVAWILARITTGELSGSLYKKPSAVAIAGDEDSFENIWVPRLYAAGADLKKVKYIEAGEAGTLDVKNDAEPLREFIEDLKITVIYFDQLLDNLGFTDNWKDKQVRDALAPLKHVVRETNVAMLATMHPNKRQGTFRDRISGSPAFNALSRSSLLVAQHPSEPGRAVVVRGKGNYSEEPPAFEFLIEPVEIEVPPEPKRRRRITIETSRITGVRETGLRVNEVLDAKPDRRREGSKAGLARKQLSEMFANGKPRRVTAVFNQLAKNGLSPKVVSAAAAELGFYKYQEGFPGEWYWSTRPKGDEGGSEPT